MEDYWGKLKDYWGKLKAKDDVVKVSPDWVKHIAVWSLKEEILKEEILEDIRKKDASKQASNNNSKRKQWEHQDKGDGQHDQTLKTETIAEKPEHDVQPDNENPGHDDSEAAPLGPDSCPRPAS